MGIGMLLESILSVFNAKTDLGSGTGGGMGMASGIGMDSGEYSVTPEVSMLTCSSGMALAKVRRQRKTMQRIYKFRMQNDNVILSEARKWIVATSLKPVGETNTLSVKPGGGEL